MALLRRHDRRARVDCGGRNRRLYIFKDELEAVLYPGVTYVEPAAQRVSYEQQLAAARAAVPPNYRIGLMQVFTNPKRATTLAMSGDKFQYGYVDPYRGRYLGSIAQGGFFDIVLKLHRTLFLGNTGRIVVELTTCWAIVLAATGIYLWWPRSGNRCGACGSRDFGGNPMWCCETCTP